MWYEDRLGAEKASGLLRVDEKEGRKVVETRGPVVQMEEDTFPVGIEIHVAEPIVDRKSVFVGRACRIINANQVSIASLCQGIAKQKS